MLKTEKKTKAKSNLDLVLEALHYHEICYASVYFYGSSDSGGIETIALEPIDRDEEFDATAMLNTIKVTTLNLEENTTHDFTTGKLRDWREKPPTLREAIEIVCYDIIDERAPGYEIDCGANGTIMLRPLGPLEPTPKPTVTFECYENEDDCYDSEDYYNDEGP